LLQWFCSDIHQHAEFGLQILTKASEEIQMGVNLFVIKVLHSSDKVDLEQLVRNIFMTFDFWEICPELFMFYRDCILETMKQIHYWIMWLLLHFLFFSLVGNSFGLKVKIHFLDSFNIQLRSFRLKSNNFFSYLLYREKFHWFALVFFVEIIFD